MEFYKENARILRECFQSLGFSVYGGDNAPYVWVGFPGKPSWDVFAEVGLHSQVLGLPELGLHPSVSGGLDLCSGEAEMYS